jgi:hypothetical protein
MFLERHLLSLSIKKICNNYMYEILAIFLIKESIKTGVQSAQEHSWASWSVFGAVSSS